MSMHKVETIFQLFIHEKLHFTTLSQSLLSESTLRYEEEEIKLGIQELATCVELQIYMSLEVIIGPHCLVNL